MAALGVIFLVVIALVALTAVVLVGISLPDISRYLRLRRM